MVNKNFFVYSFVVKTIFCVFCRVINQNIQLKNFVTVHVWKKDNFKQKKTYKVLFNYNVKYIKVLFKACLWIKPKHFFY